ncbi:MAG TPA: carboxypeptidase-like regulatory domain-containing protein [Nitrospirota bacterium]|nr:carboxypeptidase-like regulatory domain-containing protein [Nitrospirota bacterium]
MKKRRRIVGMKPLWMAGLLVVLLSTVFTMAGCSKDSSKSTTNPNPETFEPKGTIQGVVRDTVTLQPIKGAVVKIGVAETTTDASGQFVLRDVPATYDALMGTETDTYLVTVDMRSAKNVSNADAVYPEFVYTEKDVEYTSLNDSSPCPDASASVGNTDLASCGTNSTNHDTPVHKLSHKLDITVGKLAGKIEGQVAGCDKSPYGEFFSKLSGIYDVKIYSNATSGSTGSGSSGHLLWGGQTDSNGYFTSPPLEEGLPVKIKVSGPTTDTGSKTAYSEDDEQTTAVPVDGGTLKLTDIQASNAFHVCSVDRHGPKIIKVTPEPGSDLSAGAVSVDIEFSEPIAQNAFTSKDPAAVGNLYDHVEVYFDGSKPKAGNTAYELEWNEPIFDKLTVKIKDAGVSAMYHVRIKNINTVLKDASGLGVGEDIIYPYDMGKCPDDEKVPIEWTFTHDVDTGTTVKNNDCTVYFSTKGEQTTAAPDLKLVNSGSIDEYNSRVASFDWNQANGAKTYNMYCRTIQNWPTGTPQKHGYIRYDANVSGSGATIDFADPNQADPFCDDGTGSACTGGEWDAFVENNEIKITYECYAVGVNSDNVEGAPSNVVIVEDKVGPELLEDTTAAVGALRCPENNSAAGGDDDSICEAGEVCGTGSIDSSGKPENIGTICYENAAGDELITAIVLQYNEEVNETDAETASNYTFTNLATGGTGQVDTTVGAIVYDASTRLLKLPLSESDPLNWITEVKGVGIPVMRTGADGILQTSKASGSDDVIRAYIASAGGIIATSAALTGPCIDPGTDSGIDTTVSTADVLSGGLIYAGTDGKCDSIANTAPSGLTIDDIQITTVGGYSGVCGKENGTTDLVEDAADVDTDGGAGAGLILTGANGVCDTLAAAYTTASATQIEPTGLSTGGSAGILPGPDGILQTTTPNSISDDVLESASASSAVKVQNVKDIAGNIIRTTGDEFTAGGEVQ